MPNAAIAIRAMSRRHLVFQFRQAGPLLVAIVNKVNKLYK
jgi:hypothetical protein